MRFRTYILQLLKVPVENEKKWENRGEIYCDIKIEFFENPNKSFRILDIQNGMKSERSLKGRQENREMMLSKKSLISL